MGENLDEALCFTSSLLVPPKENFSLAIVNPRLHRVEKWMGEMDEKGSGVGGNEKRERCVNSVVSVELDHLFFFLKSSCDLSTFVY